MSANGINNLIILDSFLWDKSLNRKVKNKNLLYIKNNLLHYDENAGCKTKIAAWFGFGSASMSNISKFIKKNKDSCFGGDKNKITNYNSFIASYNDNHCLKKAKKIKEKGVEILAPKNVDLEEKEKEHQLVKSHLANCHNVLKDDSLGKNIGILTNHCKELKSALDAWSSLGGSVTKEEKQTLNAILEFKNELRASLFPANTQALKGPSFAKKSLEGAGDEDRKALRTELKEIRSTVLKKYFHERLELDAFKLAQLRTHFDAYKDRLHEPKFLENQLNRWEKKLEEGKPIAIPKWYHCTKDSPTLKLIADSDILYARKGTYPGAFVSNKPEVNMFGRCCFARSDHIEKTGIRESGQKNNLVHPTFSAQHGPFHYSDTPLVSQISTLEDNQDVVQVWVGFQRGKATLGFRKKMGTKGIPIERMERIRSGSLKYYKDTTVAFIFDNENDAALKQIGQDRRIQVVTYEQLEAIRTLINVTFYCTLPMSWKRRSWF